jgi:tetratricopeptide (TPR) repeat protein
VVVELSPDKLGVRRSSSGVLGLTNHFLDKRFKADASNDRLKRYTTSKERYRRLMQLLDRFASRIDPETAALILRNRTAYDDDPLALGNRNALDALIATHGVVVDLTEMVLWVSSGPQLIGPFAPVDLKPIFGIPVKSTDELDPIPADPLKGSAELDRLLQCRAQIAHARSLGRGGKLARALDYARRAVKVMDNSPDARKLLADLLWQVGSYQEAKKHYRTFLKLHPPYLRDVEIAKARLTHPAP